MHEEPAHIHFPLANNESHDHLRQYRFQIGILIMFLRRCDFQMSVFNVSKFNTELSECVYAKFVVRNDKFPGNFM